MIIDFSVRNFGSIKDEVTLSFEATNSKELEDYYILEPKKGLRLLKIGLLYGANGSGKTTVISALNFLRSLAMKPSDDSTTALDFEPFLFDEDTPNLNTVFKLNFIQEETKYYYEVELNRRVIVSEILKKGRSLIYSRHTDEKNQLSTLKFGSKTATAINKNNKIKIDANTIINRTVIGAFIKINVEFTEVQKVSNWFKDTLRPLVLPKTNLYSYISSKLGSEIDKKSVIKSLQKADLKITDITERDSEKTSERLFNILKDKLDVAEDVLYKMKKEGKLNAKELIFTHSVGNDKSYELPYKKESAGTQRYYQFSGLIDLMSKNEAIFCIDELESSLHPDLFKHFLLTFLTTVNKSQLIATTHNRELLISKDILRSDAIWFVDKKDDGSTDLYSLADFDTSIIRETSSIYNAYKIGKLGAKPNVNDSYLKNN
jgi:AAA15 family ATPase/GTPase